MRLKFCVARIDNPDFHVLFWEPLDLEVDVQTPLTKDGGDFAYTVENKQPNTYTGNIYHVLSPRGTNNSEEDIRNAGIQGT